MTSLQVNRSTIFFFGVGGCSSDVICVLCSQFLLETKMTVISVEHETYRIEELKSFIHIILLL